MRLSKLVLLTTLFSMFSFRSALAEPLDYILDNDHTHIVWKVERFGFTNTVGSFADIQGTLKLDEEKPEDSSVTATISLAGVRSDLPEREDIIRDPFWLDGEKFPEITFTSTKVSLLPDQLGKRRAIVTGDLTLKGVTKPVNMIVHLNKIGIEPPTRKKAMGFSAYGTFKRSDFGVTTAMNFVGDDIPFEIEALAIIAGDKK